MLMPTVTLSAKLSIVANIYFPLEHNIGVVSESFINRRLYYQSTPFRRLIIKL